jgi:hypothetical protein
MKRHLLHQVLGAILVVLLSVTTSQATIRYVAQDGSGAGGLSWATAHRTIDAAIQAASAGDEIRVKQGIYGLSSLINVSKAVLIVGGYSGVGDMRDPDAYTTTIDGQNAVGHCLDISANAQVYGFTFTRASAWGSEPYDRGAAIYVHNCSATIGGCTFHRNVADYIGGAICLDNAGGTSIDWCVFTENRASELGGAIACYHSDATITNCQFEENQTGYGFNDGYGGAIHNNTCAPIIMNCTFSSNSADYGAALCNYMSDAYIEKCQFTDCNSTTIAGGGMYNIGGAPTISKCLFQDNRVSRRGGAILDSSLSTFINCILWNNSSMVYGGAVHIDAPTEATASAAKFLHCTMYGNTGFQGGALYSDNATPSLVNCILWGNVSQDEEYPEQIYNLTWVYHTTAAASYCDIGDATTYPGTGNIRSDPSFANAAGGDFQLSPGSPCIDRGTNSDPDMPSTDYADRPRIRDGNQDDLAVADMGAYEVPGYSLADEVHRAEILQGLVYDGPSDTTPDYTFLMQFETTGTIDHIAFRTPAGNTFTIPNAEHTSSGNVETSHREWPEPIGHVWQYRATFPDASGLSAYGDGTYVITYYRTNSTSRETRVAYNFPGGEPIGQPSQKPNVTSPAYGAAVASPVTLTWDACTDLGVNKVFLTVINAATDETAGGGYFDKSVTASDPYTLAEGTYDVELSFGSLHDTTDDIGIPFEIGKMVTTTHQFSVLYTTVYRFWSPVNSVHFYTISPEERDVLIASFGYFWTYEGPAFHTAASASDPGLMPVYRFWSGRSHFYTISEEEKDILVRDFSWFWTLEGVAFYAYPEGQQPEGSKPVYRFWNVTNDAHFYTISEEERDILIRDFSYVLLFEGIAFYAFP